MLKDFLHELLNLRKKNTPSAAPDDVVPNEEEWGRMLAFVRSDRIGEEQIVQLVDALSGKVGKYVGDIRRRHPKLTANELEICNYIVEGKGCAEIARLMGVGTSTIKAYRCRIRRKLRVAKGRSLKVYLDSISRLKR